MPPVRLPLNEPVCCLFADAVGPSAPVAELIDLIPGIETMDELKGQCMCGAVRFTAQSVQTDFAACHCKMCQRWAGSALLATTVRGDDLTWIGQDHIARFQSSDWAERAWCTNCGSGLWYRITAQGPHQGEYEIPVGLFDDTTGMRLVREIFTDRKSEAFAFAGDHEMLTEAQVIALFGPGTEGA
jgi:hypothetical protein